MRDCAATDDGSIPIRILPLDRDHSWLVSVNASLTLPGLGLQDTDQAGYPVGMKWRWHRNFRPHRLFVKNGGAFSG
jgi:hypothetical protein